MQSTERIEVRKIFIGSAFKFGLLYGLAVGLIMGILTLVTGLLGYSVGGEALVGFLSSGDIFVVSGVVFLLYFVLITLGSVIGALLYNLAALLGGRLHVGLAEYAEKAKPMGFGINSIGKSRGKSSVGNGQTAKAMNNKNSLKVGIK